MVEAMIKDKAVRTAVTRQSHSFFFNFYFAHYVKYPTAQFQKELFYLSEQDDILNLFIVAFRGSGKSTIMSCSYPLWAILGRQQKKFVLLLGQTRHQAKQMLVNIKRELESNELLKNDLGPFQEESDEWGSTSLVFLRSNARITAASTEQSIRGLRHNQHRPDLIIGDDVEDINSTKTREGRHKTYEWLTGEVIPSGDRETRLIIVGNLLHEDSLMMRIKKDIVENKVNGVYKFIPLIDEQEKISWPGKFPTLAEIEAERMKIGNEVAWQREYLLRIIADEGQVILPEWIQFYDEIPTEHRRKIIVGVDLAIAQTDSADKTAMVSAMVVGKGLDYKVYVLPNPVNQKINFPETIEQIKNLNAAYKQQLSDVRIYVENVGYQQAVIDQLENDIQKIEGVKVVSDKRSRLASISTLIQSGNILFPKVGAEELIQQLKGFGVERYDDLVDAFSLMALKSLDSRKCRFGYWFPATMDEPVYFYD